MADDDVRIEVAATVVRALALGSCDKDDAPCETCLEYAFDVVAGLAGPDLLPLFLASLDRDDALSALGGKRLMQTTDDGRIIPTDDNRWWFPDA